MSESQSPPLLCHVRVLYLGSAVPLITAVGIESIQKPCHERYLRDRNDRNNFGIDATLTVFGSGLMLSYLEDNTNQSWFPTSKLNVCAAVKAVDVDGSRRFESLDNLTVWNSRNPPLFAYAMHRLVDAKVLDCHVFQCSKNEDAMSLVQSSMYAYEHKQSWPNCTIPPNILLPISQTLGLPASTGSTEKNSSPPSESTNKYRDKTKRDVDLHPTDVDTNLNDSCRFNTYLKYTPSIVGQRNGLINTVESSTSVQNSTHQQQLIPVINQLTLNYPVMMQMNPPGAPISQHLTPSNLLLVDAKPNRQRKPRTHRTEKNRLTNESDGDSSSEEEEIFYVKRSEFNNVFQNDHLLHHHTRETIEQEHRQQLPGTQRHKPTQTASVPTSRPSSYYSTQAASVPTSRPSSYYSTQTAPVPTSRPSSYYSPTQSSQQPEFSQQHAQSAQSSTDFVIYAPQSERSTNSSDQREFDKHTNTELKFYDMNKPCISGELNQVSTNTFVTPSPQNNEYYNLKQVSVQTLLRHVTPANQHKSKVLKRYDVCATGGNSDHGTYLRSTNVPQPVNIDKLECGVYERRLPTETKLSEPVSSTFEAALPKSKINYTQLTDGLGYFP